ncbi:MAG: UDP-N-acetylglucosamine 2-epimerase (hydrolyzing) [Nitrospirae bacterium]|nr:UDP-N-acetylglucosamine 2-epimerase (hydrolyzing) [Nitrospirota bacterium]
MQYEAKNKRKIVVFTGNRAEYGLLNPVIKALSEDPAFETTLIISGTHLSGDFGKTAGEIDTSNLAAIREIVLEIPDTDTRTSMLLSVSDLIRTGVCMLKDISPDCFVLAGDRYETFAMALTSFYCNIPIAHIFGGDLSQGGHLDDSVRHSITKLSHIHFTTNEDSFNRVLKLGEEPWRVFNVGTPVMDNVLGGNFAGPEEVSRELSLDLNRPMIIFTQHPVTTETDMAYEQAKESLEALKALGCQTVITYPCNDAGSEHIIKAINEYEGVSYFRIRKSLGWRLYLGCLRVASCVAGNSSSGLMETPIFKVPCVNIGTRQQGRLRADNVIDVSYDRNEISAALQTALNDSAFIKQVQNCSNPYGQGGASKRIAHVLSTLPFDKKMLQKKMTY